ncbi:transcriptional regulator, AraC family [Paenibacillus algicola]|uniref:Transcriptional regulator, AraC family n=1 Tax=Paenibacillus algicola TaxID=2565926 RepID=A0A4P8XGA1_9BACL|nr:AraC family transcriptional regulator [Paenibacillus algicola]QCT01133.1 transcriptional regulator, AraC family [Paenibacillus algicola]
MNRLIANRGLLQIFFALQLVVGIMFIFNYMVYKNSISGIYEKVTENNRMVIRNIIQSFDASFTSINNLMFNIHALPFNQITNSSGQTDMEKVLSLEDSLARMVSTMDFVENAMITYDYKLVITPKGTSSMEALFDRKYTNLKYNSVFWQNFIRSEHDFTVFPAETYKEIDSSTKRELIVAVDSSRLSMSSKKLMVLIDVNRLLNSIDLKGMIPGASLIVMDGDRNLILSTEKNLDLVDILNDVYFNPSSEGSLKREDFEYNFYKSDYNGFIYINKLPYQFQNIGSVTSANQLIMYGAIVLAGLLSILLSIYLYRPVRNIAQLLGSSNLKGNDFVKIQSGIVKIQRENESLKNQMQLVDAEIQRGVFLQTLEGYSHSREYEIQLQNHYADWFQRRYFMMASVHLTPAAPGGAPELTMEEVTARLREAVTRGLEQAVVFHEDHLKFLLLLSVELPAGRRQLLRTLEMVLKEAERQELQGFRLQGCVSRVYESKIVNCRDAYQEIQAGFEYRDAGGRETLIDAEASFQAAEIHFPLHKIEKLSNCLLAGKQDEAAELVDDVIEEYTERHIQHHQLVHMAKSMMYVMLRQGDVTEGSRYELFRLETEVMRRLQESEHAQSVRETLQEGLRRIGAMRSVDSRSKLDPAFISQYIELHYMENLYLDHMAEVLETSSKYFSNYFKKTFGVNFVEYLNKVRLSHAREYLKHSDLSIAEIGEKTGYTNSSTFTTTFKKYCGVSPSEYRKKAAEQGGEGRAIR